MMLRLLEPHAPDAPAILAPGRAPLAYGGLRALCRNTVARLNALGLGRGDRIAIVLPNGPEMASAFVSVAAAATTAPLNPAYRADELDFYLSDIGAKAILVPTFTGRTASAVSRLRPQRPIVALTHVTTSLQHMAIEWGVTPLHIPESADVEDLWRHSIDAARDARQCQ